MCARRQGRRSWTERHSTRQAQGAQWELCWNVQLLPGVAALAVPPDLATTAGCSLWCLAKASRRAGSSVVFLVFTPVVGATCLGLQVVAEHLFHEGQFEIGDVFVGEADVAGGEALKAPYASMHAVLQQVSEGAAQVLCSTSFLLYLSVGHSSVLWWGHGGQVQRDSSVRTAWWQSLGPAFPACPSARFR